MDYSNISLNKFYLILSCCNKNKTTFKYLTSLSIIEFIYLYYLLINLIIYLLKNNLLKFKNRLGSIKEEELSNQNSKIYDENSSLGNNYIDGKRNNVSQKKELLYSKFVEIIQNLFKKYFMKRVKKLNIKKSDVKMEENNNNDKTINRIYSKRNKYKKIIALKEGS